MKTYLFNILTQSFKEKNLIFEKPAVAEKPEGAAKPADKPKEGDNKPKETPEEKKTKIKDAIKALAPKFEEVLKANGGYTEDFVKVTGEIKGKFEAISKKLDENKDLTKDELKIFDEKLEKAYDQKNLDRNKKIQVQKVALEAAKTNPELTADKIWEAQKSKLEAKDIPAPIVEAIKAKFDANGRIENEIDFIKKTLEAAEKGTSEENAEKNMKDADEEMKNLTKEYFVTKKFTETYNNILDEVKKISNYPEDVKTPGTELQRVKTAIFDKIAKDIKESKEGKPVNPNSFVGYQQELMYAHVADVLGDAELTPEKIKSAITLYDLGKYKNGRETKEATAILTKLMSEEVQDKLKAAHIRIDFMGGTDGNDHQLKHSKDWHTEKVAAFDKLLEFDKWKHLTPPLTDDDKTEIAAYKKAVTDGKQDEFLNDAAHKNKFITGGTLLDHALALQRAEDKAEKVKQTFDPSQRYLNLELGTSTAADNEEKKSGIAFNIETVDVFKPQYDIKGNVLSVIPPVDPKTPDKVPAKLSYQLAPVEPLKGELKAGNPPTITVEGRVATLELVEGKLVSKDKDPNDEDKKFTAYCTLTVVEPKGETQGTIKVEKIEEVDNQPGYKMTLDGSKLSVKYNDEEKAREFTVGKLPEGMKASLADDGLALTLGEDKSLIRFDYKGKIGTSFFLDNMSLNRSFTVALDTTTTPPTIKVEKREKDVDHGYIYNKETKELTVKNKDNQEVKKYKIEVPEAATVEPTEGQDDDWYLTVTVGEKYLYLEFADDGSLSVTGPVTDEKNLGTDYDASLAVASKTIELTAKPKEAAEKHVLTQNADKTYSVEVSGKKYNLNIPGAVITPEKGPENNYLKIVLDGKEGHLDLDKNGENATAGELFDAYNLKVDGLNITLEKKAAAADEPPAVDAPQDATPVQKETSVPEAPASNPQPVEQPEVKPAEFDYKLSTDGKTLSFKDTNGATFDYNIIKPAEANIALSNGDDKYFVVELNGAKASFEFNPQTGQFETGPIVDAKDLRDEYTIEAKSNSIPRTISILKKEAVVNNPPLAPLKASFKTTAEYNAAYDKYDKDVWKPWAAEQIEANKDDVTKIETPDPEEKGSEKIIKEQIKKIEDFISQKGISVIDFSSTDCGPCQWMKPLLYQLAGQGLNHGSESVKFANFNQNSMGDGQTSKALEAFMKKYGINSFPSLLVFKDGKLIVSSSGREDNKDKLKAKLTAALVAHDENPDAVIDTYTTELLGKIKSKSFEENTVGTYDNLQARTVIAITSDWKDLEPKAWGLQCHYETGGSGDKDIIRYKDPETGKYLYFDGGHKLIELGEKPPKPEEHKAILKELFKDFVPGTYFEKLEEPVYLNETNTWSVKFKYSAASEAEEKKEKNEYGDAISYLTKYLDSKGLYVNNRIQGGSLSYSNNNVIIAVEDVDSFKDIKPPLVLSGNTLTFTPRGGQPKNYVLPSGYIYEPYFKVDSVNVFEKKNNVNIHLGSISFSDGKPSAFSMKEGVVTVENDVIKIVSPKD